MPSSFLAAIFFLFTLFRCVWKPRSATEHTIAAYVPVEATSSFVVPSFDRSCVVWRHVRHDITIIIFLFNSSVYINVIYIYWFPIWCRAVAVEQKKKKGVHGTHICIGLDFCGFHVSNDYFASTYSLRGLFFKLTRLWCVSFDVNGFFFAFNM